MNKTTLLALLRHGLTTAGGALASKGLAGSDDIEALAGAIVTIVGVVWSIWEKRNRPAGPTVPPVVLALFCLLPLLTFTPGCLSRTMKRYDPVTGSLWSTEKFSVVLMRGEASKLREEIKETAEGGYERKVSVGALKGETETDKLKDLAGEVVERGISAGIKAAKP